MTANELLAETHPGRTILEDVVKPLGSLNDIVRGRRGITADTALRLARYLGTTAQFWLNLQSAYELRLAERWKGAMIRKTVNPRKVP